LRTLTTILASLVLILLVGCGQRTVQISLIPVDDRLSPQLVAGEDAGMFADRIALVEVSGLLVNFSRGSLLSTGTNPVSDFREVLDAIARDDKVKAVVLRLNTPGGTVTASEMMYRDLLAFKKATGKPVVVSMMDVCASGGYYLSCAADYRYAYPTTITGSIGVIMQTMNFTGTMAKLGITAEAFTSGPNKDTGSPLRPMKDTDRELLQHMVTQFYGRFVATVKAAPNHVQDKNWTMVTDGRVVTGQDAAELGLVDALGSLDDAIAQAKQRAGLSRATLITYKRTGAVAGSVYAQTPANPALSLVNINIDTAALALPSVHPQFLYLWTGQ